jgi:branched-chain amino acid transport system substrate-binding protein
MIRRVPAAILAALVLLLSILLSACDTGVETPVVATLASVNTTPTPTIAPTVTTTAGPVVLANDIRIGLMGPFTGPGGAYGLAIKRGAQMAVDEFNKEGGVNGRKVALIERDDKSNPADGLTNVNDLIEKEKVLAVFGTANNQVGLAQAPVVQAAKVPWVIPLASGTAITQEQGNPGYIFRVAMVDRSQSQLVVKFATARYKKIAIIYEDSPFGTEGENDLTDQFQAANITPVLTESYKPTGTSDDFKPLIAKLKTAAPDLIVDWGMGAPAANLKRAMKDLNLDWPMVGPWSLSGPDLHNAANGLENGTYVVQTFSIDTTLPNQVDFINRYKQQFKTDQVDYPSGVAQAYDAMRLLCQALKQPGAAESRDKLRAALENSGVYEGVIKRYDRPFSNPYHEALTDQDYFLALWRDGKMYRINFTR